MMDLDKIIKSWECCLADSCIPECPMHCCDVGDCIDELKVDTIEALKKLKYMIDNPKAKINIITADQNNGLKELRNVLQDKINNEGIRWITTSDIISRIDYYLAGEKPQSFKDQDIDRQNAEKDFNLPPIPIEPGGLIFSIVGSVLAGFELVPARVVSYEFKYDKNGLSVETSIVIGINSGLTWTEFFELFGERWFLTFEEAEKKLLELRAAEKEKVLKEAE